STAGFQRSMSHLREGVTYARDDSPRRSPAACLLPRCNLIGALEEAGRAFRRLLQGYEYFEALANHLAMTRFSEHQLRNVINLVLPLPDDDGQHPRLLKARSKVIELFHAGTGIEGQMIQGTAWAALQ
ncbi:DUF932 domain-containing protein, partial [Myxococcus sp. AM001]|nr:DUF932 domain-containing protein [Myxococcus sp. AM001]